jgi:hypothetical protein
MLKSLAQGTNLIKHFHFRCEVCQVSVNSSQQLQAHLIGMVNLKIKAGNKIAIIFRQLFTVLKKDLFTSSQAREYPSTKFELIST